MTEILKVLVGSQAHGLATPKSDYDYRGVWVAPTREFFTAGQRKVQETSWIEGLQDDTGHELGKFLFLATKSNPNILEVFLSPRADVLDPNNSDPYNLGDELRGHFDQTWSSVGVYHAYVNYSNNQEKKFRANEEQRKKNGFATAYLRALFQGWELLTTGTFHVNITDTEIFETAKRFKAGEYTPGEVINECDKCKEKIHQAYRANPNKETDYKSLDAFLQKVRKEYW